MPTPLNGCGELLFLVESPGKVGASSGGAGLFSSESPRLRQSGITGFTFCVHAPVALHNIGEAHAAAYRCLGGMRLLCE
jgi:hypothetical protein